MLQSVRLALPVALEALAVAAASVTIPSAVWAVDSVKLVGGPTYSSAAGGFQEQYQMGTGRQVTNSGTAIGLGDKAIPPVHASSVGMRPFRFSTAGVTELGLLGTSTGEPSGAARSEAHAINNGGMIVGGTSDYSSGATPRGQFRPVRWAPGAASPTLLDRLPRQVGGFALGVNDAGMAIGMAEVTDAAGTAWLGYRLVRWQSGGTAAVELGHLGTTSGGFTDVRAFSLNAAGTAVGYAGRYDSGYADDYRPVRWEANSTVATELGGLGASSKGQANAINTLGTIVGRVSLPGTNNQRAVRWNAGSTVATSLGPINTDVLGKWNSDASAINDGGAVVGWSEKYSATGASLGLRAVRWNAGSTVATELPSITSTAVGGDSRAAAINHRGSVVGFSTTVSGGSAGSYSHATLWLSDNTLVDLHSLVAANSGWTLTDARDVSDTGWITGAGFFDPDASGPTAAYQRTFLMLVPDAGTYGLGDADFDTHVDFADLVILAQHYNLGNAGLNTQVGDFDLDGATDFDDLVTLAQHYGSANGVVTEIGSASFAADWALAQSLVPEPAALSAMMALAFGSRGARRANDSA